MNQEEVSKLEVLLDSTTHPVQVRCLRPREGKFSKGHTAAKKIEGSGPAWLHHETPPCATLGEGTRNSYPLSFHPHFKPAPGGWSLMMPVGSEERIQGWGTVRLLWRPAGNCSLSWVM